MCDNAAIKRCPAQYWKKKKKKKKTNNGCGRVSRVNKHLRLDKIAIKGFSPEISSCVPFLSTVENPHKSLHGKSPIFTQIQNEIVQLVLDCTAYDPDESHTHDTAWLALESHAREYCYELHRLRYAAVKELRGSQPCRSRPLLRTA